MYHTKKVTASAAKNMELVKHLMERPIGIILKGNESASALKLMCVVDYKLNELGLYGNVLKNSNLLKQLLSFQNYEHFHYYQYRLKRIPFKTYLLQCEICKLIAPYNITMDHMVLNHGRHESAQKCQWCCQMEIHEHTSSISLERCYRNYIAHRQINATETDCSTIIEVFSMFQALATTLQVKSTRDSKYLAAQCTSTQTIQLDDTDNKDISREILVTQPYLRNHKTMNLIKLEQLFQCAMDYFNVNNSSSRSEEPLQFVEEMLLQQQEQKPILPQQMELVEQIQLVQEEHHQQPPLLAEPMIPMEPIRPMHEVSSIPSSDTTLRSNEVKNLANFMTSAIENIRNDEIRRKTLFDIQKTILYYSNKDLQLQ